MIKAFWEMPTILKFLTAHALACFLFVIGLVIPGSPMSFNGVPVESQEFWDKGYALPTFIIGIIMPLLGVSLLKKWVYSRHIYSVVFVLVLVAPYVYWQEIESTIFGVVLSAMVIGYLFINGKVREYFNS